ncbi:MAG: malonic semialdehyde reductase [Siculibacillus sp.]|nr:malonic semialdehyde reductase [Siculibacillus sp.]
MSLLDSAALDLLFRDARTHNGWTAEAVTDGELAAALDLAKMAPTAANSQPLRVVFVRSAEAKAKLKPVLSPGNVDKTMAAPVTAIVAYDPKFYDHLPKLFPHVDARSWFAGDPVGAEATARLSATLQAGYLILALRAVGLDTGPMGGFDAAGTDAAFFPGGEAKSLFLINIGHGDPAALFPRNPRLDFDEMAKIM